MSRLCLSKNKKIAGVCGGIAERYGFEVAIVRGIALLLLLLFLEKVLTAYIILWIALPSQKD